MGYTVGQVSAEAAHVPQRRGRRSSPTHYSRKRLAEIICAAKTRSCLMCSNNFHSRGAGHRVCDNCKGTEAWQAGNWP
jgi:hypothetical protein